MAYILYDIIMRSVLLKYYAGFPIIGVINGFIRKTQRGTHPVGTPQNGRKKGRENFVVFLREEIK